MAIFVYNSCIMAEERECKMSAIHPQHQGTIRSIDLAGIEYRSIESTSITCRLVMHNSVSQALSTVRKSLRSDIICVNLTLSFLIYTFFISFNPYNIYYKADA